MHNAVKALACEGWHYFAGIAHYLFDSGIGEEFLRPGIQPCDGLHTGIKLDSGHTLGSSGREDSGITQPGRRIENRPAHRGDRCYHALCVLPGIDVFDTMHDKASDQHTGCALRWQQAAYATGCLREHLYRLYSLLAYYETFDFCLADLFNAIPVQPFTSCKAHAFVAQRSAAAAHAKIS